MAKTICRWLLIALCLGELALCGLFSVTGIVGLCIAVLALPVAPVRTLWKRILPPDAPRFAKAAILAAATLVMLAAVPAPASEGKGVQAMATIEPSRVPAATATLTSSPATSQELASTATPEPGDQPVEAATPAQTPDEEEKTDAAQEPSDTAYGVAQGDTVYVAGSGNGSKYHTDPNCSRMKDAVPMTRAQAESRGYTPCSKCCG